MLWCMFGLLLCMCGCWLCCLASAGEFSVQLSHLSGLFRQLAAFYSRRRTAWPYLVPTMTRHLSRVPA
jgi:hypothetical protein